MDIDDIYLAGKNAAYDIAAKKLLASRKILAWILGTLIKSQNQISYGFLYIASSTSSLNSSLFASNVSSLCIKIQE